MPLVPHDPATDQYAKVLVHAPGGRGKTRLLGTAQEDERTYPMAFLNFDSGTKTLVGLKIDVFDIVDWNDYNEAYALLSDPKCKYKSVGIDSVSETQVGGLLKILQTKGTDALTQPDWGDILVQMRRFVRHYKFLPMHVFMTALSKADTLPKLGIVQRPSLQGQFADDILGLPDTVGYLAEEPLEDGSKRRTLLLAGFPQFMVKARRNWGSPDTALEIVDPTITKLLDTLGYTK